MTDSDSSIASLSLTQTSARLAELSSYITERRGIAPDTWATPRGS